jgi:MFS family permease
MTSPQPSLRSYAASSFLPAMIYEIGNGAIMPILVTTAIGLGASTGVAAFTLSLLGVGRVIGDVPAAWVAERFGDRQSMMMSAGIAFLAFGTCMIAPTLLMLQLALTILGMTSSTFYLARQSYLIEVAPVSLRARAQSTLAGSHRIGLFIGPFLGAAAISLGGIRTPYVVAMATAIATAVLLFAVPDVEARGQVQSEAATGITAWQMLRTHWRLFFTLGFAVVACSAIRQAYPTILPLWAHHIGLSPAQTSIIVGIANGIDMTLFYPSGKVMDRWGRLAIAVPAMLTMGVAMICLIFTRDALEVTVVAMAISFGNGIGSGIVQTIGADAAPIDGRRRFLGIWRLFGDTGTGVGPLIVSLVAAVATFAAAIVTAGVIGFLAALGFGSFVPKFTAFATPRAIRLHQQSASQQLHTEAKQGLEAEADHRQSPNDEGIDDPLSLSADVSGPVAEQGADGSPGGG